MAASQSAPLTPIQITCGDSEYQAILAWQFVDEPFYECQVLQVLGQDIPRRMAFGCCAMWAYRDSHGNVVGFGTLDICQEYARFTGGTHHCYIPVLAVNTAFQRQGHGRRIVDHLAAEAVLVRQATNDISDLLFLDVYSANKAAAALYEKCGFTVLNPDNPIPDPAENNETYLVMAKRVSIASP